ncbi:MAG: hypothetical protein RIT81_14130 [Deltaproteobacteria bacterium]
MKWTAPAFLSLFALATACGSSVEGTLTIDGTTAELDRCESLEPKGFDGVDLVTTDDRLVRLYRDSLGTEITEVSFFPAGRQMGPRLGACATGSILDSNTRINDVVALDGDAKIDCDHSYIDENNAMQRVVVSGDVIFEGCH